MGIASAPVLPGRRVLSRAPRWVDPAAVGIAAFLVSVLFSWVPSVWYDEAATIVSATRSWPELFREVGTIDAVHAVFYGLMHVWLDLVGYTPFTLRLPSALAVGVAAALLVILLRRLSTRTVGILGGLIFAVLPRTVVMGGEGRSYALATAASVGLLLLFVDAARRSEASTRRRALAWSAYGLLAFVGCAVNLYLLLAVAGHGVTALWLLLRSRGSRAAWRPLLGWAAASAIAIGLLIPLARLIVGQSGQVAWIDPIGAWTVHSLLVNAFFVGNDGLALTAWVLAVAGLASAIPVLRRRLRPAPTEAVDLPARTEPSVIVLLLPLLLVPAAGLVTASLLITPLYSPRYLSFAAPAIAGLMALGVTALLPARIVRVFALVGIVALAAPTIASVRALDAKPDPPWTPVADLVAEERAKEPAGTKEAVIFGPLRRHPTATSRAISYAYPDAFEGLVDVNLGTPARESGRLWETHRRVLNSLDRMDDADVVWLVTSDKQDWRPSITEKLAPLGFAKTDEWHLEGANILRYAR